MKAARISLASMALAFLIGCGSTTVSTDNGGAAPESKDPTFANIVLTDDETSKTPKTEFSTTTPKFYAFFELRNMPASSKIRGVWYCEKSAITPANYKIDEATLELKEGMDVGNFNLSKPNAGWPEGDYRLDLVYNEKVLDALKFKVVK